MAVALKLAELANDAGFQRRVTYALRKQSVVVVAQASPVAEQLVLAKRLLTGTDGDELARRLVWAFLGNQGVADALDAQAYNHLAFTDATIDTAVAAQFATMAKAL